MKVETKLQNYYKEDCIFLKSIWPKSDVGDIEHYLWKYLNHIDEKPVVVKFIEESNRKIVARSSFHIQNAIVDDTTYKVAISEDTAVHPKYRNLKLFMDLMNNIIRLAKQTNCDFIYAMPNRRAREAFKKLLKFQSLFKFVPMMYVPNNMTINYNLLSLGLKIYALKNLFSIKQNSKIRLMHDVELTTNNIVAYGSSVIYDRESFYYRFFKCPTRRYYLYDVDNLFFVGRFIRKKKIEIFFILNTLKTSEPISTDTVSNSLVKLAEYIKKPVAYFLNSDSIGDYKKNGFCDVRPFFDREFEVIILPLKKFPSNNVTSDIKFSLGNIDIG